MHINFDNSKYGLKINRSLGLFVVDAATPQPIAASVASAASTTQPIRQDKSFDCTTSLAFNCSCCSKTVEHCCNNNNNNFSQLIDSLTEV